MIKNVKDKWWEIPPLWYGEKVVILATGPSLTTEQCNYLRRVRNSVRVIVVNDAYKLYPEADLLYACDMGWWEYHNGVPEFKNRKCSMQPVPTHNDVMFVENDGNSGISTKPGWIRNGRNSAYQAMNIAIQLGSKDIGFLGLDLKITKGKPKHFFGEHPKEVHRDSNFKVFIQHYEMSKKYLDNLKINVVNCTPGSALKCFPEMSIQDFVGE